LTYKAKADDMQKDFHSAVEIIIGEKITENAATSEQLDQPVLVSCMARHDKRTATI